MAWPSNRRLRRTSREGALGYIHRTVGQFPGDYPIPLSPADSNPCPPGFMPDIESESCVPIPSPPGGDTPITNCGPPQRYNMPGIVPGCPEPPGRLMYMGETQVIQGGGTALFEFDAPGIFCPQRLIITSTDIYRTFVVGIRSGIRNQIISRSIVPAVIFSKENNCCPLSCLDCICAPGVKMSVEILNSDAGPETVNVSVIGVYYDIPAGMTAKQASETVQRGYPGCPVPGRDKIVGFGFTASGDFTLELETPGRFCPKQLFFAGLSPNAVEALTIFDIKTATDSQVIEGGLPGSLFSVLNKCCVVSCLDCLCAPGVPMVIQGFVGNEVPVPFVGAMIGPYEDVC